MRTPQDVDVVVVSWNVRNELIECLRSVEASRGVRTHIVVVDNSSGDGSADAVAERFPKVRLVRNATNVGFARGVNQGITLGGAPWVLLLNPDSTVPPDAIASLVSKLDALTVHAMIVPRLVDGEGRVQHSAYPLPSLRVALLLASGAYRLLRERDRERLLIPGSWNSDKERDVPWALGAAMLVRRSVIDRVGGMDESFFVYAEDIEYCDRLWSSGYRIRFTPDVTVVHLGNRSGAQRYASTRTETYLHNTARFVRRRHGRMWTSAYIGLNGVTALSRAFTSWVAHGVRPTEHRHGVQAYWRDQARYYINGVARRVRRRQPIPETSAGRRWLVLGATYPPLHFGGYELMSKYHVASMRGIRVDPVVLTSTFGLTDGQPREDRGESGELIVRALDLPYKDFKLEYPKGARMWLTEWRQHRILASVLTRTRPEAAVVWMMGGLQKSLLVALHERGLPIVVMVHEDWPIREIDNDGWTNLWSRRASRRTSRVVKPALRVMASRWIAPWNLRPALEAVVPVYCSDFLRREVEIGRPEWRGRGIAVHDGIDVKGMWRQRGETEPFTHPLRLLYAGRVEWRKGAHTAIAVLARLRESGVMARLRFVGWRDEGYTASLRAQAAALSVDSLIEWTDALPHEAMPDIYRDADILLFPTIWSEPFGLVPLEAMAAGCVVVATGSGGSGEYLQDGENALLYHINDDDSAAKAVLRLLESPDLVRRLRRGGWATVKEHSVEQMTLALNTVVEGIIATR